MSSVVVPLRRVYRPSNGTEGIAFYDGWCDKCKHDTEDKPCDILARSMMFDISEPGYPSEWVVDKTGPKCLAWTDRFAPPVPSLPDPALAVADLFPAEAEAAMRDPPHELSARRK